MTYFLLRHPTPPTPPPTPPPQPNRHPSRLTPHPHLQPPPTPLPPPPRLPHLPTPLTPAHAPPTHPSPCIKGTPCFGLRCGYACTLPRRRPATACSGCWRPGLWRRSPGESGAKVREGPSLGGSFFSSFFLFVLSLFLCFLEVWEFAGWSKKPSFRKNIFLLVSSNGFCFGCLASCLENFPEMVSQNWFGGQLAFCHQWIWGADT